MATPSTSRTEVPPSSANVLEQATAVAHWQQWQHLADDLEPLLMAPQQCHDFVGRLQHLAASLRRLVR